MAQVYLVVNAIAYLGFSLWCTVATDTTSRSIGFRFLNGSGRSEYITVYGGLELGMAVFFALTAFRPELRMAGLLFALCTYAALAVFRLGTLVTVEDVGRFPWVMFAIELPMALLAGFLYLRATAAA